MTISFSIPFWIFPIILILIGVIGFFIIAQFAGYMDFFTPFVAVLFGLVCVALGIGLWLGKYLFS